jgi:predicted Zn-dependent protease
MKKTVYFFALLVFVACSTVPMTGRKQMKIISDTELNAMAFQQYGQFIASAKLSADKANAAMIQRVGEKLTTTVEAYLASIERSNLTKDFEWEFNLVDDPSVNAWAMPGGKIVFYSGILPLCKDEAGVAVVMGHEIAHIIAGHGNERMSQGLLANFGIAVLDQALKEKPEETRNILLGAVGAGAQVGILLPFSRTHEKEADRIGLIIMTMAGYDPHTAPAFWERMMKNSEGHGTPEFLSTHPSSESRVADLKASIPEALTYRK